VGLDWKTNLKAPLASDQPNGNAGGNGKGKGAAIRAFDIQDVAGPDIASILSG
jgi:hypothetical protein